MSYSCCRRSARTAQPRNHDGSCTRGREGAPGGRGSCTWHSCLCEDEFVHETEVAAIAKEIVTAFGTQEEEALEEHPIFWDGLEAS